VSFVLKRVNSITGVEYRNDPAIFAWELMNEPDAWPQWRLGRWLSDMAAYVKSIDRNHMVGSGQANVSNNLSDIAISELDFAEWHGYPVYYKLTPSQFNTKISDFCGLASEYRKPVLLEEFGYARSNPDQVDVYRTWLKTIQDNPDCSGWLVWRLVSRQDDGKFPADEHDQFDIHRNGGRLWDVLSEAARQLRARSSALQASSGQGP